MTVQEIIDRLKVLPGNVKTNVKLIDAQLIGIEYLGFTIPELRLEFEINEQKEVDRGAKER